MREGIAHLGSRREEKRREGKRRGKSRIIAEEKLLFTQGHGERRRGQEERGEYEERGSFCS